MGHKEWQETREAVVVWELVAATSGLWAAAALVRIRSRLFSGGELSPVLPLRLAGLLTSIPRRTETSSSRTPLHTCMADLRIGRSISGGRRPETLSTIWPRWLGSIGRELPAYHPYA